MANIGGYPTVPGRGRALGPAWLVLLAGCLLSGAMSGWFWREAEQADRERFGAAVTNLLEHLDTRTERYAEQLERCADAVAAPEQVSAAVWAELVGRLAPVGNLPAFLELAYATNAALPSRAEVAAKCAGPLESFDPLPIRLALGAQWRNGSTASAAETESWLAEPVDKPRWWRVLNGRMCSTRQRRITGPDGRVLSAVGLLVPVFAADVTEFAGRLPATHQEQLRGFRCRGVVLGTLGWEAFLRTALPGASDLVAFDAFVGVEDGQPLTAETWLAHDGLAVPPPLEAGFAPRFRQVQGWPFYRTRWQLVFHSTPAFERQSSRHRAWVAMGVGLALSALMAALLGVQIQGRRRQEAVAVRLQAALRELESARSERERLSHDLHDGTIQSLYALQLGLGRAVDIARGTHSSLGTRLEEHVRHLTAVIGELRVFILRHETDAPIKEDLAGVLCSLIERLRGTTEAQIRSEISTDAAGRCSGTQAVHLANLAREALSNAVRHAQARQIHVALRAEPDRLILAVEDDGIGFNPGANTPPGFGIASMRKRAQEAGGELQVTTQPGQGCRIRVVVPAVGKNDPLD